MTISGVLHLARPTTSAPVVLPRRRFRLRRVLAAIGVAVFLLVAAVGISIGVTLERINHAVHHVTVSPALLARGQNDLLAVVIGPHHSEELYAFHTTAAHTNVLQIPSRLEIPGPGGHPVPIASLNIHSPSAIIAGLSRIGIPVGRYVGVDLHAVSPTSNLGRLAEGKISITSLLSNPTGISSLMESVASHVYLGPHTPTSALLALMKVPAGRPVSVPTSTGPHGRVVLAAQLVDVMRRFL